MLGRFPATGYQVEMADYGMDNYRPVPGYIPSPSFTVKGLTEGKRYMFRIRAENMYGLSEPLTGREVSVCSDVIRAENMYDLSEPLTGQEVSMCM